MTLKKCILTANDCYKQGIKMTNGKPTGIVVHSTAANNTYISRYVQPLKSDSDYNATMADLGANKHNNHWNQTGGGKCVHAFIGRTTNGSIATYQTLPFDMCCWGSGSGTKGSYNTNPNARIQFEICEDDQTSATYFNSVYKEAVEFCAYICKTYNLNVSSIVSHAEAHKAGYASNHGDPDHWFKKFNKTMSDFRAAVTAEINKGTTTNNTTSGSSTTTPPTTSTGYTPGTYKITQVASLNVRKGPGMEYGIIKSLPRNTVIEVTKIENKAWGYTPAHGGWCNISTTYCTKTTTTTAATKPDTIHTVVKGETLSGIAKKYGTTIAKLESYNSIKDINKISIGQKIKIPQ